MEAPTVQALTQVAGIGVAVSIINFLIWQTAGASDAVKARFGPILAVGSGVVVGILAGLVLHLASADLAQAAINGVVGGLTGIGIYDTVTSKAGLVAPTA